MNDYAKDLIDKELDYTVVKSNILALNARYQYTVNQQKTISYICSKIQPIRNDSHTELKYPLEYYFEIAEYLRLLGIESSGNQYKLIKATLQSLSDKSMWIPIEDENGTGEMLIRWFSNVIIYKKSGRIKIKLDEYLAPYILELRNQYLSYELINILNFNSKYSIRLYEMFKAYYNLKCANNYKKYSETPIIEWIIDLDELRHVLMIDTENKNGKYKNFKDFRKYVIEIAQKEINSLSDIKFDFEPITKGRKTIKVKFLVKYKEVSNRIQSKELNRKLFNKTKETEINDIKRKR